jgi:putative transposase
MKSKKKWKPLYSKFPEQLIENLIDHYLLPIQTPFRTRRINLHSWIDAYKYEFKHSSNYALSINSPDQLENASYNSLHIPFFPTITQINILDQWFELYRNMLNITIKFFKNKTFKNEQLYTNFQNVRTNFLKIQKESLLNKQLNNSLYAHSLDYAIKDVCTNIKSALTNLKQGHIKHFRLRYIKQSKTTKIVKIEKTGIKIVNEQYFCPKLGTLKTNYISGKIESDFSIIKKHNKYYIAVPQKIGDLKEKSMGRILGIDMGVRTFLSGYTQTHAIDICNNSKQKIQKILDKIDKINSQLENGPKKQKAIKKRYQKITNLINELHWKSTDYLTKNYDGFIVGNFSTSSIIRNKNLNKNTKRYVSLLRPYVFQQRLKYKASVYGKKIKIVDEAYTSKICSNCGNLKEGKFTEKIYNCKSCKIQIDRDHNSAKNMLLLGI